MRLLLSIFLLTVFSQTVRAQDVIILKKNENRITGKIVSINDTVISYKPSSNPKITETVRRVDVLSWLINAETPVNKKEIKNTNKDFNAGLLGIYRIGESVPGYLLTAKSDTISGRIRIVNMAVNQVYLLFTDSSGTEKRIHVNDENVAGYGFDEVEYAKVSTVFSKNVSNDLNSETGALFLHQLVDGPATLYRFYTVFYPKSVLRNYPNPPIYLAKVSSHYLMISRDGKKLLSRNRTIKGCVNRMLNDDKVIMEKVRMKGIRESELIATFKEYNLRLKEQGR